MTQKEALDLLKMGKNIYLTGQAGSGKTYLLNKYIKFLKGHRVPVAITASTGIAATHLNGNTIHSWSGIGIKSEISASDLGKIARNSQKREKIRDAKVLIIDEISMLHGNRLNLVNKVCKYIRKSSRPFGGLQVILCGDFFQLPPIQEHGDTTINFAYKSDAWKELEPNICYLDEQHRQLDDSFLRLLNEIRSQEVTEYTFEKLQTRLNKSVSDEFVPTKLYTHNLDVDKINQAELAKIDTPSSIFKMVTKGKKELIETLKKGCLAPEELELKIGASVMFIKNNPSKGYINGTVGKVIKFSEQGHPIIRTFDGREVTASPVSWPFEEGEKVIAEIGQIPLRLAWAITVHKSQGMSLDAAQIDLSKSFAYGMGYVALSRVKSLEGIKLLGINQNALLVNSEVAILDIQIMKSSIEISNQLKLMGEARVEEEKNKFLIKLLSDKGDYEDDMFLGFNE